MPIEVACGTCGGVFNAPDSAGGKRTKCPTCGGAILIPHQIVPELVGHDAAAVGSYDDRFSMPASETNAAQDKPSACPQCGMNNSGSAVRCEHCNAVIDPAVRRMMDYGAGFALTEPGWRQVSFGLSLLYYAVIIFVLISIIFMIGLISFTAMNGPMEIDALPPGALIGLVLGGLVVVGAGIAVFVGQVQCANVPKASGARGFIVGSLICMLLNFLLTGISTITNASLLGSLGNLVSLAGSVLFILFVRQTAIYLHNQNLASSAVKFLVFSVGIVVLSIIIGIAAALMPPLAALIGLVFLGALIVSIVWYLRLISGLKAEIDRRIS